MMDTVHLIKQKLANRVLLVDVFAALFGMGSWLLVDGVYNQLPSLVDDAPESWNLSSYIVVVCQAGNVGLIVYEVIQRYWKEKVSDEFLIGLLMSIGCISVFLMAFFYKKTTDVGGTEHSVALLVLFFGCSILACTSSVLFIPYMNRYKETYLVSYMIGEGLSGFVPSIISLIQGVGSTKCVHTNSSDSSSSLESVSIPPNFSVSAFLITLCCLQALSLLGFVLLNIIPACKMERMDLDSTSLSSPEDASHTSRYFEDPKTDHDIDKSKSDQSGVNPSALEASNQVSEKIMNPGTIILFLIFQVILSLFANGLLTSIQSYSCEPYGTMAYHLSINLGNIANPLACYLLFFVTFTSVPVVSALFSLGAALAVYITIAATMSPDPPLVGTLSGEILVVICWVVYTGLVSYTKLAIATRFRQKGGNGLFWFGTMTQVGGLTGAVIGFVLLNYTTVFTEYSELSTMNVLIRAVLLRSDHEF